MSNINSGYSTCPHCGQGDSVQRVSSIVTSQSQVGSSFSYGFVGQAQMQLFSSSQGQTLLSQRLSPPQAPKYRNPWAWIALYLLLASPLGICGLVSMSLQASLAALFVIALYIGPAVAIASWCKNEHPRRQAKYNADLHFYHLAIAKWENLYYCHRDDGVFLPGQTAQFILVTSMMHFLFQP